MAQTQAHRLGQQRGNFVRKHARAIAELPDPRGKHPEFTKSDPRVPDWVIDKIRHFCFNGVVEAEQERPEWIFQADIDAYIIATNWVDTEAALPCGHTGFTNTGDGYDCTTCGRTYSRQTVADYLSRS